MEFTFGVHIDLSRAQNSTLSCGANYNQIHCGCIVSFHAFVLLDAGGIECITCARKSFILTPNPAWPPSSLFVPLQPERIKDTSGRNWSPIAGSGPVPWHQAPSMFNATSQTDLQSRVTTEVHGLCFSERLPSSSMEDSLERLTSGNLKISCLEVQRGTPANVEEQLSSFLNQSRKTAHSTTPVFSLVAASTSITETDGHRMVAGTPYRPTQSTQVEKQYGIQNQVDVSEAQLRYFKVRGDAKARRHLLRYRPRTSEEELQKFAEQ